MIVEDWIPQGSIETVEMLGSIDGVEEYGSK
jgi:hypothetical protein